MLANQKPIKIFPSQLGFSWNGLNIADSNSSCWRYIQLSQGVKTEIHPLYRKIGEMQEDWHSSTNLVGEEYDKELPFKFEVNGATISGRTDYRVRSRRRIDECKATFSKSTFDKAPKPQQLAQIALYLGHFQFDHGIFPYGFYQQDGDEVDQDGQPVLVLSDYKLIEIRVKDSGSIVVEKRDSGYTVEDVVTSAAKLAGYLKSGELPPMPYSESFIGPCDYCPLRQLCNQYNLDQIDEATLRVEAPKAILAKEQQIPKISKRKRK